MHKLLMLLFIPLTIAASSHDTIFEPFPFEQLPIDLQGIIIIQTSVDENSVKCIQNIRKLALINRSTHNFVMNNRPFNILIFNTLFNKNIESALLLGTPAIRDLIIETLGGDPKKYATSEAQTNFLITQVSNHLRITNVEAASLIHTDHAFEFLKQFHFSTLWVALNKAIEKNEYFVVKSLLHSGTKINLHDYSGFTPLMIAVKKSLYPITKLLIKFKADTNARNKEDLRENSVLDYVSFLKDISTIKKMITLLIKNGCKINDQSPADGDTALMYAVSNGNKTMIKELLQYGADKTLKNKQNETALDVLQRMKCAYSYLGLSAESKDIEQLLSIENKV